MDKPASHASSTYCQNRTFSRLRVRFKFTRDSEELGVIFSSTSTISITHFFHLFLYVEGKSWWHIFHMLSSTYYGESTEKITKKEQGTIILSLSPCCFSSMLRGTHVKRSQSALHKALTINFASKYPSNLY